MSELPNPVNFDAAQRPSRGGHPASSSPSARTPDRTCEAVQPFVDAGFDHIVLHERRPRPGRLPRLLRRRPRRPSARDGLSAPSARRRRPGGWFGHSPRAVTRMPQLTRRTAAHPAHWRSIDRPAVRLALGTGLPLAGTLRLFSGSSARSAPGCPRSWSARSRLTTLSSSILTWACMPKMPPGFSVGRRCRPPGWCRSTPARVGEDAARLRLGADGLVTAHVAAADQQVRLLGVDAGPEAVGGVAVDHAVVDRRRPCTVEMPPPLTVAVLPRMVMPRSTSTASELAMPPPTCAVLPSTSVSETLVRAEKLASPPPGRRCSG